MYLKRGGGAITSGEKNDFSYIYTPESEKVPLSIETK